VIVAEPALTAATFPLLSTEATLASDDFQLTALLVALLGVTVAVSVSDPLSAKVRLVLLSDTPVTATVCVPPPPFPPFGPVGSSFLQLVNIPASIKTIAAAKKFLNNFLIA
jgi:hypothetical protein